jgi:hypothetical protein
MTPEENATYVTSHAVPCQIQSQGWRVHEGRPILGLEMIVIKNSKVQKCEGIKYPRTRLARIGSAWGASRDYELRFLLVPPTRFDCLSDLYL